MILYNEIDPYAAQWLRNLGAAGHIAPGTVDERSIRDLRPDDVRDATQAHFFAGIGVWSYALRAVGVPDTARVWTGSCPCQPFSAAGKREGVADERHLWPAWFELIRQCRPAVILGEQVSSPDGLGWFDLVSADLEGEGYAIGALDTCAAGVGAPHIRQRLYFVAYAEGAGSARRDARALDANDGRRRSERQGATGGLGDASSTRGGRDRGAGPRSEAQGGSERREHRDLGDELEPSSAARLMGDARIAGLERLAGDGDDRSQSGRLDEEQARSAPAASASGFWSDAEWIPCQDGKMRPVEPGTFPLAHGAASRVGRLRAYGNALCAPQAIAFLRAALGVAR